MHMPPPSDVGTIYSVKLRTVCRSVTRFRVPCITPFFRLEAMETISETVVSAYRLRVRLSLPSEWTASYPPHRSSRTKQAGYGNGGYGTGQNAAYGTNGAGAYAAGQTTGGAAAWGGQQGY